MWKTPLPTPQGCGQPRVAGCRGLHTCETLTRFVMDNPSGYPHAACQTAIEIFKVQKSEYQYLRLWQSQWRFRGGCLAAGVRVTRALTKRSEVP